MTVLGPQHSHPSRGGPMPTLPKAGRSAGTTLLVLTNVALFALFGIVAELVLRAGFDPRYAPRTDFEVPDPRTVWAPAPNLDGEYFGADYSMHVVTDEHGNRLSSLGAPAPRDRLVVLVGDSYTFGWGVSTDDTFAADLDRRLVASQEGVRVVNLGVAGYGTLAMAERLKGFLAITEPRRIDAIVLLHADNDPVDNVMFVLYQNGIRARRFSRSAHSPSRLVNFIASKFRRLSRPARSATVPGARLVWAGEDFGALGDVTLDRELDLPATKAAAHLTPLQSRLMRLGVEEIDRACEGCGLPIHHVLLNLADHQEAYAVSQSEAFRALDAHGNRVTFHGLLALGAHDYSIPAHNAHRGGHFTPAFNREYGALLHAIVRDDLVR
jgi:GDSL-like Lipase/Acylhydrolase family